MSTEDRVRILRPQDINAPEFGENIIQLMQELARKDFPVVDGREASRRDWPYYPVVYFSGVNPIRHRSDLERLGNLIKQYHAFRGQSVHDAYRWKVVGLPFELTIDSSQTRIFRFSKDTVEQLNAESLRLANYLSHTNPSR